MMLGKSIPEYIFIRVTIATLQLVTPLSVLYVAWALLLGSSLVESVPRWSSLRSYLLVYASLEAAFFLCVYLPRRYHLQKATNGAVLSREERRTLFQKCAQYFDGRSAEHIMSGWFFQSQFFQRDNIIEWLLWALFSTSMNDGWAVWKEEIAEYSATFESVLGRTLPEGYNKDTPCMRLTLDPVRMLHRPLVWYMIVGVVDFFTCLRLYVFGFRHYSDKRLFQSFPPRPFTLFSRPSNVEGFSYWYRPHRSLEDNPVLFLHGVGIGLYPYTAFLVELASQHPGAGIVVPEFLSISSRITSPPLSRDTTVAAIQQTLDALSLQRVVIAAHSYGTVVAAQLWRSSSGNSSDDSSGAANPHSDPDPNSTSRSRFTTTIAATLFVDPIPFLLHLPDVAYNFVYRSPAAWAANEWLLWYFASRDPDVARTLSRHFFWAQNVLWREDLSGREVAVALSGQDQVVNAEAVWRYLTGEDGGSTSSLNGYWRGQVGGRTGQLEVLCYPELDHSMIFQTRERRRRLICVLERFVRRLD